MPRQLANVTHARPQPPKLSPPPHAERRQYGGLVEVSLRYTPVAGGLHTRYAPVRRSPPVHCCTALPLDLHVLGLPLAFILSQDQTLHCKNCFVTLDSSRVTPAGRAGGLSTHAISLVPFLSNHSRLPSCSGTPSGRLPLSKAGAKIRTFSNPPKFFFTFFSRSAPTRCAAATKKSNFFFTPHGKPSAKRPPRAPFFRKLGTSGHGKNTVFVYFVEL